MVTLPFHCHRCNDAFEPAEGGHCRDCGHLFCRWHLRNSPTADGQGAQSLCSDCRAAATLRAAKTSGRSAVNFQEDPIVKSSARWFWWIAGLSLVNAVMFLSGSDINFVLGLAMTTFATALFQHAPAVAVVLIAVTVGFYFAMGWYAQRGKLWAFYAGLALYVVDALIYLKFEDWMSVGFHALAAFFIAKGVMRVRELSAAPAAEGV